MPSTYLKTIISFQRHFTVSLDTRILLFHWIQGYLFSIVPPPALQDVMILGIINRTKCYTILISVNIQWHFQVMPFDK